MKSIRTKMVVTALSFAVIFIAFHPGVNAQKPGAGVHEGVICNVTSFSMNKICKEWDGQWQGIGVASDGNCYFATSTHSSGHGAGFHVYDPVKKEHRMLVEDMTILCGEEFSGSQQGKIHSPIVELDGWLYFTTHLSNYWPEGIDIYTGAHVLGYEIATGKFRDFGIVKPRYSIYSAIQVDPERKVLYVMLSPFQPDLIKEDGVHLYSVDIASGEKKDLGQLTFGETGGTPWFYVDNKGNCWFTLWKREWQYEHDRGNLYCYSPEAGKIITYKDVLPKEVKLIDGTELSGTHMYNTRCWNYTEALPGRERCLFAMGAWGGGDERLWIFDPSKDIASGEAFEPIANIGTTFHETARGGDRLYFVQYEDLEVQRTISPELARDEDPDIVGYNSNLHLRSISLKKGDDPNQITDHGKIVDQDGRAARMINALAADAEGRVYMTGDWYIKSDREASMYNLLWDHPGERLYSLMKRGLFFAVAETGEE